MLHPLRPDDFLAPELTHLWIYGHGYCQIRINLSCSVRNLIFIGFIILTGQKLSVTLHDDAYRTNFRAALDHCTVLYRDVVIEHKEKDGDKWEERYRIIEVHPRLTPTTSLVDFPTLEPVPH